jgi:hypothetical protein
MIIETSYTPLRKVTFKFCLTNALCQDTLPDNSISSVEGFWLKILMWSGYSGQSFCFFLSAWPGTC